MATRRLWPAILLRRLFPLLPSILSLAALNRVRMINVVTNDLMCGHSWPNHSGAPTQRRPIAVVGAAS
jgi:hypothetical protein